MGRILYCNKAAGGQCKHDLEHNLACTLPHGTHSPRLLYCLFLWQRSVMWSGILIVSSKLALMVTEKKKTHHELRLARDVFMVTGALSG